MKKIHENELSIVPSQMFVLTFQTRLYIEGWLNFTCNTQTFFLIQTYPLFVELSKTRSEM